MKNHQNFNNNKNKSKPKQNVKQRGYYYSSANINKRQEIKNKLNNQNNNIENNDIGEDFFSKQKNANKINKASTPKFDNENLMINTPKIKNNLELYNKNMMLLNFIECEKNDFSIVLNKLKMINCSIGNLILKPKIKNDEINKKIIRDKEKKEQEEINFNKNISDKIDAALNRANIALDNIKYLGNPKYPKQQNFNMNNNINMNSINNSNTKYNYSEFKKEKEKINLFNIAQKCLDRYEENIQINNNNHDDYFITVSKTRKLFKDAKEQLQSAKYRLRNSGMFFDEIFNNNKKNNYKEEPITLIHLNKQIFFKENNIIRISSFLKSEIFKKLFVKVLYNENFIENPNLPNVNNNNKLNNSDIYNIFSLWYMVKEINLLIKQISENNKDDFFLINKNINEEFLNEIKSSNIKDNVQNNLFIKHHIFDFIEKYLAFLNRKNNDSININENQIFTSDYNKLYEIFFKLEQSKISKYISENIENNASNQNIISKEELNYYKNIQSIFKNKGKYICSIINK